MTVVALCSGKGSPGVSTLACVAGAVWPADRRILIAECDPSGNDLAVRFGLSTRLGMTSLILASRRMESSKAPLEGHTQPLPGGLEALVGPVSSDAAFSLDRELGALALSIIPGEIDILVDCGRILAGAPGQGKIIKTADHVVLVTRPDGAALAHAVKALDVVRDLAAVGTSSVVVVGSSQFRGGEIEQVFPDALLGVIPRDEKAAAMACGSPGKARRFARSSLVASTRVLVDRLLNLPPRRGVGDERPESASDGRTREFSNQESAAGPGCELARSGELGTGPA
jgi:MinD-like ATPase involved in chromosome partitioning or flagellar assembly